MGVLRLAWDRAAMEKPSACSMRISSWQMSAWRSWGYSSESMPMRIQCSAWELMERLSAALATRRFSCICSEILTMPM